jgi:calcineurin-like phosphoesterase family protein
MRFFTSDMHYGHANIIHYSGRPHANIMDMGQDLMERWNSVVAPHDEVYVVGDVAMGKLEQSLEWIDLLQGTIYLVPGNHDTCWAGRGAKARAGRRIYEAHGMTVLGGQVKMTLADHAVEVCHFPFGYVDPTEPRDKFADWRPQARGQWLLHGHVHERWRQRGREINVGVDAWGGFPVSEVQLAALIAAGPQDLAPLAW